MPPQQRSILRLLFDHRPEPLTSLDIQRTLSMRQPNVHQSLEDLATNLILLRTGWRLLRSRVPNPSATGKHQRPTVYAYTLAVRA